MSRPRILVLSFSPIATDARVLRQVRQLSSLGDVTTCGFGPHPEPATEHLQVPAGLPSLPLTPAGVADLGLRRYRRAERAAPALAAAARRLAGRRFDLVVANDARALPLAHDVAAGAPVWADMHEWAAEEFSHDLRWRLLVSGFADHLCKVYLPRSAAVTTVCDGIAELYTARYGVACSVLANCPDAQDLHPSLPEPGRLRLVHSGIALRARRLDLMLQAVAQAGEHVSLDLFLMPAGDGGRYLAQLRREAAGCGRITFRDPVPPAELPRAMNGLDVGVFLLPPSNTNARLALPNKFFDFVQARLGVLVGPSPEMARLVRRHSLGWVADGFTAADLGRAIAALDDAGVARAKAASAAAAHELSAQAQWEHGLRLASGLLRG
ncbi:glycosyltransferase family 4 protein [Kineococcus sp. NUM-3379]